MRGVSVASGPRPVLAPREQTASLQRSIIVPAGALGAAAVVFIVAIYQPLALFFLAPVVFGVPHVAADIRYLVLRRGLPSSWKSTVLLGCACLLGLRAIDLLHPFRGTAQVETVLATAWVLAAIATACSAQKTRWRAWVAGCAALTAGALACAWPAASRLALLHAHNLVALAAWGLLYRSRKAALLTGMLLLGGAGLLASGCVYRTTLASGSALSGSHLLQIADWIAPGLSIDYAVGSVSAYVFLQAAHYAIWLGVIPAREQPRSSRFSVMGSLRSLRADFGRSGLVLLSVTTLVLLLGACWQLQRSRSSYIALANFHVYLELVMLTYFWVQSGPAGAAASGCNRAEQRA